MDFVRDSRLFDYNQPRTEEYHGAGTNWTGLDTTLMGLAQLGNLGDWRQTSQIQRNPDRFTENWSSALMGGPHPSEGRVNTFFATKAALMGLAALLPASYRRALLGSQVLGEAAALKNNSNFGLKAIRW